MEIGTNELSDGLSSKRALVTGGTQGIGQAVVQCLTEAGARVVTTARHGEDSDRFIRADVSTADGAAKVASAIQGLLGGVDIIVHVVGGQQRPQADSRLWTMVNGSAPLI